MTRQVSRLEDLSKPHLKTDAMGRRRGCGTIVLHRQPMERRVKRNDLSQSLVAFDQASRIVSVVEFGLRTWLVAGLVPGLTRLPLKKLGADAQALLTLLRRWQGEATKARQHNQPHLSSHSRRAATASGFARWLQTRNRGLCDPPDQSRCRENIGEQRWTDWMPDC